MVDPTTRREDRLPLLIEIDGAASIVVALVLWLAPLGPWSFAIAAVVLAILVVILIMGMPWRGRAGSTLAKLVLCVICVAMLAAVLVPNGIARFRLERTGTNAPSPQATITAPLSSGSSGI